MYYRWTILWTMLACVLVPMTACGCVGAAISRADRTAEMAPPSTQRKREPAHTNGKHEKKAASSRSSRSKETAKLAAAIAGGDSGRITICLVTSANCVPCRKVETTTLPTLESRGWKIAEYESGISANIHRMDLKSHRTVAARWKIETVPTWIVFRGNRPVRTVSGILTADDVIKLWNEAERVSNAAATEKGE